MPTTGERFERAVAIMARLRAPGGCPWDREQTFDSIRRYTVEETYEVLEAIDNRDWEELPGELGDLLLQVLFYSQMAQEESRFSIDDVLDRLARKLTERHPHVFGETEARTSAEVLRNWERLKAEEEKQKKQKKPNAGAGAQSEEHSLLAGVSPAMPALLEAFKLSSRAAGAGFDWPQIEGLLEKLEEEIGELRRELEAWPAPGPRPPRHGETAPAREPVPEELRRQEDEARRRAEDEVGDLFFTLVNVARYLALDPESALRRSNRKFRRRFRCMEERLRQEGRPLAQATQEEQPKATLEEMEALWQQCKQAEAR
jgi:MazG family protein